MKMKGFIYSAIAGLLIFASCSKSEMGPVISENPVAPVLTAPAAGTNLEILEEAFSSTLSVSWEAANYGFDAAISYSVQMDLGDGSFTESVELLKTSKLTGDITYGELNNKLLAAGAVAGAVNDLNLRVVAKVSDYVTTTASSAIGISVKPFYVEVSYPALNVPGNYQGWAPDNMETVIYSLKSDEVYDGYIYFGEASTMYKFAKGTWDVNWGDDENDGSLEAGGADIPAAGPAMYRLHADLNALTHTAVRTDWGLIGSATPGGWDADQDMTWDTESGMWTITIDLVAGDLKFRANDDWEINLGDDQANLILEYEGENIVISEAGNYTITLNLKGPLYKYSVKKN